jgi:tripartite-type tricarboxylate transporter receptor subunit TctC
MNRRMFFGLAACVAAMMAATPALQAQEPPEGYPSRPIDLVVVYPAGGGMDVTARILASEAERVLGHSFRVQNRTGGGGLVGHSWFANEAEADGYNIGILANPNLALDFIVREGDFEASDFLPIAGINFAPVLWTVSTTGPLAGLDFNGVIEKAKAEPGTITISNVTNSPFDFVIDVVEEHTGAKFVKVPFQGGKPGVVSMLGGNVGIASTFYDESEPHIRAGDMKILAAADAERFVGLPDVPTMDELGVPMIPGVWGAKRFVVVPPETPENIRNYLEAAMLKVMNDPEAIKAFEQAGIILSPTGAAAVQKAYNDAITVLTEITAKRAE